MFAATAVLIALSGRSQGLFNYSTLGGPAPTHIGSIDGPLAGTNIWAQMLAGPSPDSLAPVGPAVHHVERFGVPTGYVNAGTFTVPGIPAYQTAYFEMLVWDGARWGTTLSGPPKDQLGMTDIVQLALGGTFGPPAPTPRFMQSAIVPVPEPTTMAIGIVAAAGSLLRWAVRRRLERSSRRMARRREE